MISVQVQEIARSRGILTAYQLQKSMGINPAMAARLWKGNFEMIALKTIDSLCKALDCEPGDLLVRCSRKKRVRQKEVEVKSLTVAT